MSVGWIGRREREEINDGGTMIKAVGERLSTGGSTAWTRSYLRTVTILVEALIHGCRRGQPFMLWLVEPLSKGNTIFDRIVEYLTKRSDSTFVSCSMF